MKTNIIRPVIEENKLRSCITYFEVVNKTIAILIMNSDTSTELINRCENRCEISCDEKQLCEKKTLKKFEGRKVFIDEEMKFGEIDIR